MARIVTRSVRIPEKLDVALKVLSSQARLDKSDLYQAGAVLVLAIARMGRAPSELLSIARVYDPKTVKIISRLIESKAVIEPVAVQG